MPSLGTCGLCLQKKELQNSHLLPAALYRQLREPSDGSDPNPIVVTRSRAFTSSKQVSSPFLCTDCELRLSVKGENYVLTQCAKRNGTFKFRELLQSASPLCVDDMNQTAVYDVQRLLDTKVDQYLYFAASVFWRASARSWKMGDEQVGKICLGKNTRSSSVCIYSVKQPSQRMPVSMSAFLVRLKFLLPLLRSPLHSEWAEHIATNFAFLACASSCSLGAMSRKYPIRLRLMAVRSK